MGLQGGSMRRVFGAAGAVRVTDAPPGPRWRRHGRVGRPGGRRPRRGRGCGGEAQKLRLARRWPGNVRELEGVIECAILRSQGARIQDDDLPEIAKVSPVLRPADGGPGEVERIHAALEQARGNRSVAARLLGVSRATFYRRLTELGISLKES